MTDINPAVEAIAKRLGDRVLWVESDIADWDSQVHLFQKAFEWCPSINFLAANAGISTNMTAPTGIMSTETGGSPQKPPLQVLDINLMGTIYSIKLFLHHIHKQNPAMPNNGRPKARIVITGSEGGLYALPADPVYCASKHGLVGITRSLGPAYLATHGITVNSINPGYMKAPLVAPLIPITPDQYETPLSTIMRAFEELLASDKNGQIVEASGKNLYYQPQQAYPDEIAKWVWDDAPAFWMDAITKMGAKA